MSEDSETFEFVDRRHSAASAPTDASASAEDAAGSPDERGTNLEDEPSPEGGHPRLAAADRLLMCLDILHQGAWIALGLVQDPVTNKVEANLPEARALIDATAAIVEAAEPLVDGKAMQELRNLVSTLRMNYVNQTR
ncbi:MAG: DUF1844 domain-containing protein [Chthonomonadales bacterium]|nr:DUF1844 domain-containing protein [Chthonomonadales bacterium]